MRARQAGRLHDPADRERLVALGRAERQPPSHRDVIAVGEFLRQDDRVGLREKHQRIVDDRLVAALEIVVAQAAIAGHVDAEDEQVALAAALDLFGVGDRLDHRHGHAAPSRRPGLFRECPRRIPARRPSLRVRSCRRCDRRSARTRTARSDSRCACRRTRPRRGRSPRSSAASAARAGGGYGQEMSLRSIIDLRPPALAARRVAGCLRRCGRRGGRWCARSSRRRSCRG